jgi:hypothetical protein
MGVTLGMALVKLVVVVTNAGGVSVYMAEVEYG